MKIPLTSFSSLPKQSLNPMISFHTNRTSHRAQLVFQKISNIKKASFSAYSKNCNLEVEPIPMLDNLWEILNNENDVEDRKDLRCGDPETVWSAYLKIKESNQLTSLEQDEIERLLDTLRFSDANLRVSRVLSVLKSLKLTGKTLRIKEYEALFYVLASTSRFDECGLLFQEMEKMNIEPSAQIYAVVIRYLGKNCKTLSASRVFQHILSKNTPLPDKAFYALLECFCLRLDSDNAISVFRKTQEHDIIIPKTTLFSLLKSLVNLKRIEYAREVFNYILQTDQSPSLYAITTMINGLIKEEQYEDALKLYRYYLNPSSPSYSQITIMLIEGFIKADKITEVLDIIENSPKLLSRANIHHIVSLFARGSKGDVKSVIEKLESIVFLKEYIQSFDTDIARLLIKEFVKTGRLDEAEETLNVFREKGIVPSIYSYHMIMDGYFLINKLDKALDVLDRIKQEGLEFNPVVLDTAFKILCKIDDLQYARDLYQISKDKNVLLTLNSFKYYMALLVHFDQYPEVQDVFLDIIDFDTYPTADLINIVMRIYTKQEKFDKGFEFLSHLESSGVTPHAKNFSYFVDVLARFQQIDKAEQVLEIMKRLKIKPTVKIYTVIIQGFVRNNNLLQAQKNLDDMLALGIKPDNVIYAVIIRGLVLNNQLGKTREMLSSMIKNGLKPDVITYSCLINPQLIKEGVADAEKFILQLRDQDIELDGVVFYLLMNVILNKLGPDELGVYLSRNIQDLLPYEEPLSFLIQRTLTNVNLIHCLVGFWSLLIQHNFKFTKNHYLNYITILLNIRRFEAAFDQLQELSTKYTSFDENDYIPFKQILMNPDLKIPTVIVEALFKIFPELKGMKEMLGSHNISSLLK